MKNRAMYNQEMLTHSRERQLNLGLNKMRSLTALERIAPGCGAKISGELKPNEGKQGRSW